MHTQLYAYLCDNHLLSDKRFAFRLKASTVTATAQFTDQILTARDNGVIIGAVFIDIILNYYLNLMVSTFRMILQRINDLRHIPFQPMSSYGLQQQLIGPSNCTDRSTTRLHPWASVVYSSDINDLPDRLDFLDITPYADDTVLFIYSKFIYSIDSKPHSDLDKVSKWFISHRLTLNINKTKFIIIGSSQRLKKLNSISITTD